MTQVRLRTQLCVANRVFFTAGLSLAGLPYSYLFSSSGSEWGSRTDFHNFLPMCGGESGRFFKDYF